MQTAARSSIALDGLLPLLESHVDRQMQAFPDASDPAELRKFLLLRAMRTLRHADSTAAAAGAEGRACGLACWTALPWDSEMFGFPAARIDFLLADGGNGVEIERQLLGETLDTARKRGIRHIIARVPAAGSSLGALAWYGFETIDEIHTFSLSLAGGWRELDRRPGSIETRLFQERDLPQVLEIARRSYTLDRFHADAALDTAAADRIHEVWLRNSCSGKAADAVVVAAAGSTVLGYATCKLDGEIGEGRGPRFGTIVLVATAEHARNRGAGMACTSAALRWFQSRNADFVHVGTQRRNIPATRLYEKCGFRLTANTTTWRKLL
jgi:ribosomal protein S18 acetylase RimI-like enzyme